jgi:hypothetical protein
VVLKQLNLSAAAHILCASRKGPRRRRRGIQGITLQYPSALVYAEYLSQLPTKQLALWVGRLIEAQVRRDAIGRIQDVVKFEIACVFVRDDPSTLPHFGSFPVNSASMTSCLHLP